MFLDHYILKDRKIKKVDLLEWSVWFNDISNRRVASTMINGCRVSTVFLGMGPVYFETMTFGGPLDDYQWRYATYIEALKGHRQVVKVLQSVYRLKKRVTKMPDLKKRP